MRFINYVRFLFYLFSLRLQSQVFSFGQCFLYVFVASPCSQRPGGLVKLGFNCTPFGLSLTVKRHTEIRIITLTPNFPKPLVGCQCILSVFTPIKGLFLDRVSINQILSPNFSPKQDYFVQF